jgi:RluA family pseudouridine synthase
VTPLFQNSLPGCVLFEDEHLLVVNKPAGWNTHAPSPYAGEGIYHWLKHREPRWASLAIIHRLDKETSGVMVFGKTPLANRSLTEQFTRREVKKKYLLLTDHSVPPGEFVLKTSLVRAGEKYMSRPLLASRETAETRFRTIELKGTQTLVEAEPLTGRTHQIRVHAADSGFPILGDTLYGGTPAPRVCLHAAELAFRHPATGDEARFCDALDHGYREWTPGFCFQHVAAFGGRRRVFHEGTMTLNQIAWLSVAIAFSIIIMATIIQCHVRRWREEFGDGGRCSLNNKDGTPRWGNK